MSWLQTPFKYLYTFDQQSFLLWRDVYIVLFSTYCTPTSRLRFNKRSSLEVLSAFATLKQKSQLPCNFTAEWPRLGAKRLQLHNFPVVTHSEESSVLDDESTTWWVNVL